MSEESEKAAHGVIMYLAFYLLLLMVGAIFLVFGIMEVNNHDCVIPFLPSARVDQRGHCGLPHPLRLFLLPTVRRPAAGVLQCTS